jgi:hypothetical protein
MTSFLFCSITKALYFYKLGGMDACDKAAKLLQCGKENSPEAVSGLMQNLETSITVYNIFLIVEHNLII